MKRRVERGEREERRKRNGVTRGEVIREKDERTVSVGILSSVVFVLFVFFSGGLFRVSVSLNSVSP